MNKTFTHNLVASVLLINLGLAAPVALAGPDFFQQQMTRQLMESKQKLTAAEAAKGTEQQKLMDEHMQMLHATMKKCRELKPKANMSPQEREEWYAEHQKLMDQMMAQMMEGHQAMMKMGCMNKMK